MLCGTFKQRTNILNGSISKASRLKRKRGIMAIKENAVEAMKSTMTGESVNRAQLLANHDILQIHLAELRRRMNLEQSDMPAFSQSSISRLERRNDIKLSTLIEYLQGIGMGMEIRVYPKNGKNQGQMETLLKL